MIRLFSHAGEVHETDVASATHLLSNWYYALALVLAITIITAIATYALTKKSLFKATLAVGIALLAMAIILYNVSPVISALSGISGILKLLFAVFIKVTKK